MTRKLMLGIAIVALVLGGCLKAPFQPPTGSVYNDVAAPLSIEMKNAEIGNKKGSSYAVSILGLFAFGDVSTHAAATNGGIKVVKHADYEYFNFLGIYQKTTLNIYGD